MAAPPKPPQETPEGSPPRPPAPPNDPPEAANEPSQPPAGDAPSSLKECSRCHHVMVFPGFVRSANPRDTQGFKLQEMKTCNYCGFVQHNSRAAGKHEDRVPTSEQMLKQLSEEDYKELYGAEAIIKGTPAGGKKKGKDDDGDDESEYVPPEA